MLIGPWLRTVNCEETKFSCQPGAFKCFVKGNKINEGDISELQGICSSTSRCNRLLPSFEKFSAVNLFIIFNPGSFDNCSSLNIFQVLDEEDLLLPDDGGQNAVPSIVAKTEPPLLSNENNDRPTPKRKILVAPKKMKKSKRIEDRPRPTQSYNILDGSISRDECSTFGEHVVAKLRKFNERHRTILMHRINNLIFEAEMELYSYSQQQYDDDNSASSSAS